MLRKGRNLKRRGIGAIAQKVRVCYPNSPLEEVAAAVFESPHKVAPVVEDKALVGLVWEEDLPGPWDRLGKKAHELMRPPDVVLSWDTSPLEAEGLLTQKGLRAAPVVDEGGNLLGLVGRAELAAFRVRALRPQRIGGMATPLGVYLTTGQVRAGAPDLGLFLTGVALAAMQFGAVFFSLGLLFLIDKLSGLPLFTSALSRSYSVAMGMEWVRKVLPGMEILLFLLFLRLSPLAGFHGAEHQVVHALERGEPLTSERVSSMPRAHRRCGTNLVALFVVAFILSPINPWIAIAVALLLWRFLGGPLQWLVTTKKPSKRQLMSAIEAARELWEKHLESLGKRATPLTKVWNIGLIQVLAGFFLLVNIARAFGLSYVVLFIP